MSSTHRHHALLIRRRSPRRRPHSPVLKPQFSPGDRTLLSFRRYPHHFATCDGTTPLRHQPDRMTSLTCPALLLATSPSGGFHGTPTVVVLRHLTSVSDDSRGRQARTTTAVPLRRFIAHFPALHVFRNRSGWSAGLDTAHFLHHADEDCASFVGKILRHGLPTAQRRQNFPPRPYRLISSDPARRCVVIDILR